MEKVALKTFLSSSGLFVPAEVKLIKGISIARCMPLKGLLFPKRQLDGESGALAGSASDRNDTVMRFGE